ncbi:hypothetical protein [Pseudarthrobacter chlorophenolicus]|nr:hypothetical protein [Pseudarthrobacter chlorophenolicus]
MSTSTARQPRGIPTGGQFAAATHSEPGIVLTDGRAEFVTERHLYERELAALAGPDADIEEKYPATKTEARRLLKNTRGEDGGKIRVVRLNHTNAPDSEPGERVEIVGPKDGRPIVVDVTSGLPHLKVTSGTAIIRMRSGWGNSIDVGPGAEAIVLAAADTKVTTDCDEGGKLTLVCPSAKNRFRPFGKGEIYLSNGTDTDRIRYEHPVYEPY